jgi:predicted small integral membrane protein
MSIDQKSSASSSEQKPSISRFEKLKTASQLAGLLTPLSIAISWIGVAGGHNWWPLSTNLIPWLCVGILIAVLGLVLPLVTRRKNRRSETWQVLVSLIFASVGSALTAAVIVTLSQPSHYAVSVSPAAAGSAPTTLRIDSPAPNELKKAPLELKGTLTSPLREGDTLWVLANDGGNPVADRSKNFTLLRSSCWIDVGKREWTCPNVMLAPEPDKDRVVTLTVVSVDAAQTRTFIEYLLTGAQIDQRAKDCATMNCTPETRKDPRNSLGIPGGVGITVTDHRAIILAKSR